MNKKLGIYCFLFWVALLMLLINSSKFDRGIVKSAELERMNPGQVDAPAYVDGWEYGNTPAQYYYGSDTVYQSNGGISVYKKAGLYYYDVYVMPKRSDDKRSLISSVGDKKYMVSLQKVSIVIPADEANNVCFILRIVLYVLTTGVSIWLIILILKLIAKIGKGEIFVSGVSKMMETTGILLSCLYLFRWIILFAITHYCIKNIELANYDIVDKVDANGMLILTGLGLMIISQIILLGKDLKDEQDLTI